MKAKIIAAAKALPPFVRTTDEILPHLENWMADSDERFREKALRIFKYAEVDKRYGIMDVAEVFTQTSFEEKNNRYHKAMRDLAQKSLLNALKKVGWSPQDIDIIITTSCTGIMIPSVDAYLINDLKMRQDILRLPVTEMGCAGGTSALMYASRLLESGAGKRAAVIALESPTSTFQHGDYSMTNVVSAAIFGDGAACALLSTEEEHSGPSIVHSEMYHFYDAIHMMGFALRNSGLQMILDPEVPATIRSHFSAIVPDYLQKRGVEIDAIDHFVFHPGGKKITQTVEEFLQQYNKQIDITKGVLRDYGNMSSATVLYVLEGTLPIAKSGDRGLMLSFGPGFSAQRLLLEWKN